MSNAACPMTGVAAKDSIASSGPNSAAAETVPAISALPPLMTVTKARAT
jgi:hypothetical protein